MQIYKFGGGSLKDPQAIEQAIKIIKNINDEPTLIVISAFAKTTNALENILFLARNNQNFSDELSLLKNFHDSIASYFFNNDEHSIFNEINQIFQQLEHSLYNYKNWDYDIHYDVTVSYGEILSTIIIHYIFDYFQISNVWLDAREIIITDTQHRDAIINWELTKNMIDEKVKPLFQNNNLVLTQGFIGRSIDGYISTLGREGSDFSAAIFANCLDANNITIWKDVPGIFNADPKLFKQAVLLPHIDYKEAFKLAYYGATVLHPKTIKPLQIKKIKLFVKDFYNPSHNGTLIDDTTTDDEHISSLIVKKDQVLISISPNNLLFLNENDLSFIFHIFADLNIKINLMQLDAFNFNVCINNDISKLPLLTNKLNESFTTDIIYGLSLVTITHTDKSNFDIFRNSKIYIEQINDNIKQCLVDSINL
jgi:aspartate kinase